MLRPLTALSAIIVLLVAIADRGHAQPGGTVPSGSFELSETVQLDTVDNAATAQLERIEALLGQKQYEEAIAGLRQLAESTDDRLLGLPDRRYVPLSQWCQWRLAALTPEALSVYRTQVDPQARQWFQAGIEHRDTIQLRNVVEQAFASSFGDDALLALGDMAMESGDYVAARGYWARIISPVGNDPTPMQNYPNSNLDLAMVRTRLVSVSIMEGAVDRAREELVDFTRLHPNARGRLGDKEGVYAALLGALLAESKAWPTEVPATDWPTFAGNPRRNAVAMPPPDFGATRWRLSLQPPCHVLCYYPVAVGNLVFWADTQRIFALHADSGQAAWGGAVAVYQAELTGIAPPAVPSDTLGTPQMTATVFANRLLARMGWPITAQPQDAGPAPALSYVVCLDLAAEGRLLWKALPDEGWSFEGSPLADSRGIYVAMRRQDIRPQTAVACLDLDTGQMRWRRFVCSAETPGRGAMYEATHNLLTLDQGVLYYNTNLGVVCAIGARDGRILWLSLYPRARYGDLFHMAPHWSRSVNPCLIDRGVVYVAPADSPRIFAFDAATGILLWQTGEEVEDVQHLLGVADNRLIAGGGRLYWIGLDGGKRGRVVHVQPDGADHPGHGRGILAGNLVLWPTENELLVFDCTSAKPLSRVDLRQRGVRGGNLLIAGDKLLIATEEELIAISPYAGGAYSESSSSTF